MITIDKSSFSPDLTQRLNDLDNEIKKFRSEGPLDQLSNEQLSEYFKTQHIYNSAGIEGNRLTLQETLLVLTEGITISEKPIHETVEVKNLGIAYDFLQDLAKDDVPITENYLKQIHQLIVGNDPYLNAGNYRNLGVIITGSELVPPEPFEVPFMMTELVEWIQDNLETENPVVLASIAHHQLAKIHPFNDGNGRTARLLLNLMLLKKGYPICSIKRTDRPKYYNYMASADIGNYEPIINIVVESCTELFSHYTRIKAETNRKREWAEKWGERDAESALRKEKSKYDIWLNRVNLIKLEFRQVTELLNEKLSNYNLTFYEYPTITFDKFQILSQKGSSSASNFFSIRFHTNEGIIIQTFMFRFFRDYNKYPNTSLVLPLELNCFNPETKDFLYIGKFQWSDRVQLRAMYFDDKGNFITRMLQDRKNEESNSKFRIDEVAQLFFEDVMLYVVPV